MRSFVLAACAGIVVGLSVPATAAPPDAAPHNAGQRPVEEGAAAGEAKITFDEYRNWRLAAMERRRSEIEIQLSAADLPAARKAQARGNPRLLQMAGQPAGGGTRQAVPRTLRPDRHQSRRRHRRWRARRVARASAGLLWRRGQRRVAPAGKCADTGREKGRGRSARLRQIGPPAARRSAAAVLLLQKQRSVAAAVLSCAPSLRAMRGSPRWRRFNDWTPEGVIPAVLLPFRADFSIDETAFARICARSPRYAGSARSR